ncbi:hypothetical protein EF903_05425 [Streptomyces sp. WAC05292]|uniref:hypothetical protein n=1 Tax=Streptomyces sp. WAC05292 TaxID=2487418 RepID=UPI000F74927B|nr:hypothetical protein [Streptomyces sp. WAC05292]RSS95081.1 hypothetical protein EF903_05425 [Streptomyces sp. WAC05292]
MPTRTSIDFTASAVLNAARTRLGAGWKTYHPHNGKIGGSLRSNRGHRVEVLGAQNGFLFTVGLLPDGTRLEVAAVPAEPTADAFGAALAHVIASKIVPAHDARCIARTHLRKVHAVLRHTPHEPLTIWDFGRASTSWRLPDGARAEHRTQPRPACSSDPTPGGPGAESVVRFTNLTVEQARTVLRAINTDNRDPRRRLPVEGSFANLMKDAAPGLRPIDTATYGQWGRQTVSLCVEDVVTVQFVSRFRAVNVTVFGSLDNQLRAIAAL